MMCGTGKCSHHVTETVCWLSVAVTESRVKDVFQFVANLCLYYRSQILTALFSSSGSGNLKYKMGFPARNFSQKIRLPY
jgi:hypothetical protein